LKNFHLKNISKTYK